MKLTPQEWCDIKRRQAIVEDDLIRCQELLADAKKFEALAEKIEYLERMLDERPV